MSGSKQQRIPQLAALVLAATVIVAPAVSAQPQHELLFFPSVDGLEVYDQSPPDTMDSHLRASADVLYSYSGERFRMLGEYLLSTDESELERLQFGWTLSNRSMLWLGRVHSPASFWVSEFHHGQYLQTSITRPALEEWEDDGGATPAHISGLLLESDHQRSDESAIGLAASVGYAPILEDGGLETHHLFESSSAHGLSVNFRVAYRPEFLGSTQFGLLGGWNEINVEQAAVPLPGDPSSIDQAMLGAFGDWYWDNLRLLASVVYFDITVELPSQDVDDSYLLGYAQLEYEANNVVTVFGRVEGGIDQDDSAYLALFEAFITERYMLGARWDVAQYHSLTFEIADTTFGAAPGGSQDFNEYRLQWSAVFP